jgi:FkbM family methyltransferase
MPDGTFIIYRFLEWADAYVLWEIYGQNVYGTSCLRKGLKVIDVGAHIGVYSLRAARIVGEQGLVISIEPYIGNFKILVDNIKLNRRSNVIPLNVALSNYCGTGKLFINSFHTGKHSITFSDSKISSIVSVKTLDSIVKNMNFYPDVVKIDAEGEELNILKGATEILKSKKLTLVIAAEHTRNEPAEVESFLVQKGFKVRQWKCNDNVYLIANNHTSKKQDTP